MFTFSGGLLFLVVIAACAYTDKAGTGFLYYPRLEGSTATAVGLNITCPPADWVTLLATPGGPGWNNTNVTAGTGLAPCGTATVSSGPELVSALEQLQAGHLRVLITLAANMSLPAQPTPQRADPAPGDDDDVPLVVLYRNVTLAACLPGHTELNVRGRRNAFGLQAGWQLLQRQGAQQLQALSPAGEGPNWLGRPVLVLADLVIAGYPPGPPASWPGGGLLGIFHYYIGMDRSGGAGMQLIGTRLLVILKPLHVGYLSYWYPRMLSLLPAEQQSAAWLNAYIQPTRSVSDAFGGGRTALRTVGDFALSCNSTASPVPLLTPAADDDFNLYSTSPAGLLTGATNASFTYTYALPPASFAIAGNATQLLALLQEAWSSGPRIIVLLRNITLDAGDWPQGGAALSYNVTLAGPLLGPPVQLDVAGLELVRAAGPSGGADAAGAGAGPVVLLLQRLVVTGLAPPLIAMARRGDVTAASGALGASAALQSWRDSCLASGAGAGAGANEGFTNSTMSSTAAASAAAGVRWEVRNSSLLLPEGVLQLIQLYNSPAACPNDQELAAAASAASVDPRTAVCIAQRSKSLPEPLTALLRKLLAVEGQVVFSGASDTPSALPSIDFTWAAFGGLTLVDVTAVAFSTRPPLQPGAGTAAAEPACGVAALLLALLPLALPPAPGDKPWSAALAGGAAAGASVATLGLLGAAAALVLQRRRRRGARGAASPPADKAEPSSGAHGPDDTARAVVGGAGGGPSIPRETSPLADVPSVREVAQLLEDADFTMSFGEQDDATGSGANPTAAQTLAEMVRLGPRPPTPGAAPEVPPQRTASGPAAAAAASGLPGPLPPALTLKRAGSLLPRLLWPGEPQAGVVLGGDSSKGSCVRGGALLDSMEKEIVAMMRRCQASAAESSSRGRVRRPRLLGRGAHGAVYLGDWRGMPAAIKVVVLVADASAARRERLAREVALTMTLDHPHIVPTYNFEVNVVRADDSAPFDGLLATDPNKADAGDDSDVAALRLKLVMQYCDGGTLRAALQEGRFSTQLPPVLRQPVLPSPPALPRQPALPKRASSFAAPSGHLRRVAAAVLPAAAAGPSAAAVAAARASDGSSTHSTACASQLSAMAGVGRESTEPLTPPQADAAGVSMRLAPPAAARPTRPLEWADITAVRNMPLSLLAALDVLRGLEYLHGRGVVHGDLTENNVLLKAAQPVLAQPRATGLKAASSAPMAAGSFTLSRILHAMGPSSADQCAARPVPPAAAGGALNAAQAGSVVAAVVVAAAGTPAVQQHHAGGRQDEAAATAARPDGGRAAGQQQHRRREQHGHRLQQQQQQQQQCSGSGWHHSGSCIEITLAQNAREENPDNGTSLQTGTGSSGSSGSTLKLQRQRVTRESFRRIHTDSDRFSFVSPFIGPSRSHQEAPPSVDDAAELAVEQMLRVVYKIADFGLSVQLHGGSEAHLSNMGQGTPFFAAPEVVLCGRLSPAADIYSFGVLLWLLLHGISLIQIRHLLPRFAVVPIGSLLLRNASRALPPACLRLLEGALAVEPAQRPRAAELRQALEEVMQDLAGPKLAWLLLSSERRDCLVAPPR